MTSDLSRHPLGKEIARNIKSETKRIQKRLTEAKQEIQNTGEFSSSLDTDSPNLNWTEATTEQNSTLLGTANTHVKYMDYTRTPLEMKSKATAGLYGSATSWVRFQTEFTPSSSGTYKVKQQYYRKGKAIGGGGLFSIYHIDSSGYERKKTVEQISQDVDGVSQKYVTFDLTAGETEKLGFEIRTTTTTGGGGGFGDFFSRNTDYFVNPYAGPQVEKL